MRKNLFIAFEGIDGSGKSTQVKLLVKKLKEEGHKVYCTSEPTDRPIGAMIRDIFQHKMEADHRTIAGLFIADRLDHLLNKSTGILKKLDEGYTVIIDRYYFSSYAYQGVHMSLDWVIEANKQSADLLRPDLNIFIDIEPDIAIQRINKGRELIELYETKENLTNVRNKFFEAFEKQKELEKIFITDGNRSQDNIACDIWRKVSE
ncbi:MAG: dTMP kinase [Paludibacter sp.]